MISKTTVKKRTTRKTDPVLVEALNMGVRNQKWIEIAKVISGPTRSRIIVNIDRIQRESSDGDTILVPGKVLSKGSISKKVRVCALSFSENAKEKIRKVKGEVLTIEEEMKKNPKMEGIKVIR